MEMKGNIKYTSEGKKVVVIGVLNSTDTIVQEIFVTNDGAEIPSGEQFIVKSLHDELVETWQSKNEKKLEGIRKQQEREWEIRKKELSKARQIAAATIKSLKRLASKAAQEQLDTLEAFVAGEITHVLHIGYYNCTINNFDDTNGAADSEYRIDDIRILSLFGKSDGTFNWMRSRYSSESSSSTTIIPARGLDNAVRIAQEYLDRDLEAWRSGDRKVPPEPDWVRGEGADRIVVHKDIIEFWRNNDLEKIDRDIASKEKLLQDLRGKRKKIEKEDV